MPFPVIKLVFLGMKQISKPLAKYIQRRSTTSPFLRNYILLPPAQFYHIVETNVKLRLLGLGKSSSVKKMNEDMAIQLASEMLGEMVVFSIATTTLYLEYRRGQRNDQRKEDMQNERLAMTEQRLVELQNVINGHEERLVELQPAHAKTDKSTIDKTKTLPQILVDSKTGLVLNGESR